MSIARCNREIAALKALARSGHPDVAGICGGIRDWSEERRLIMRPYYECSGVVLYHGDCREILPGIPTDSIDVVLTDPPYPGLKGGTRIDFDRGVSKIRKVSVTVGTPWGEDVTPLVDAYRVCRLGMFVFCSYHCVPGIPAVIGAEPCSLVTWYKRNSMPSANNVPQFETEYVWAFKKASGLNWRALRSFYDIPMLQAGCMASERYCEDGGAVHPAQKPIALISALLRVGGMSVLDPYAGTGTTLAAAKRCGMKATGIEIEERYCELIAKRLEQEVLDFGPAPQPQPEQPDLLGGAA